MELKKLVDELFGEIRKAVLKDFKPKKSKRTKKTKKTFVR